VLGEAACQLMVPAVSPDCSTADRPTENVLVDVAVLQPYQSLSKECEPASVTADSGFIAASQPAAGDVLNTVTPTKLLMKKKIKALQSQRWKLRRKLEGLTTNVKTEAKERKSALQTIDSITTAAAQFLKPLQLSLFRTQMLASQRQRKGMRWPTDVKTFALQLQYKSAASYRFLSNTLELPSSDTLLKFVNSSVGRIQPGFSATMFRVVGLRVKDMKLHDRQCSLVFDELSLKCELAYDKFLDRVTGYTDNGLLATHALVFMVRGLRLKWKQAIAYFFTHSTVQTSTLSELVKTCIDKLKQVGLYVRCVVCDQGSTNVAALRQLGYSESLPELKLLDADNKVYVIFDVPHLIKNVRNNFMKHHVTFGNGETFASWADITEFYSADKQHQIRLAPRLTDGHIDLTSARKMRVRLAAQVLSHSVAAGINTLVALNRLNAESAKHTADFVEKMDVLFDLMNSRLCIADKPARCALSSRNDNLNRLQEMKQWISTWQFKGVRNPSVIKCHWGLITSVTSIISLTSELLSEGLAYVCTSRFNQDCIENFFNR
jgi:hypothetical protein